MSEHLDLNRAHQPGEHGVMFDSLVLGRRIREVRGNRGLTLQELGSRIGRATSHVSMIETGKREIGIMELQRIAVALDVETGSLLGTEPTSRRSQLEVALERAQRSPLFERLGLPPLPVRKSIPDQVIELILGLFDELERVHMERIATPEEARRVNTALRAEMRRRHNYFGHLERKAEELLAAVGHTAGPLPRRVAADLATHLGFSIHHATDLPKSTRSLIDLDRRRIYLPMAVEAGHDSRSTLLQALAGFVLEHRTPEDYAEFLQQRVESNYLAAALLMPERDAVPLLAATKGRRELSVEDFRDAFAVTYETAAHRFTNLATEHLGIPVHFLKVHESGTVSKAYENDDALLPTDVLGTVEGQTVCRYWSARQVFDAEDRFSPYHQFTDKPRGTYWCTSSIETTSRGAYSLSVGTTFAQSKWFRGRDTQIRLTSSCPDDRCCRTPPTELADRWADRTLPLGRLNSALFSAMAHGVGSGVDLREAYSFLDRHDPRHDEAARPGDETV
jgi:XRE family transcriptional regulator, fatty acid utilization regulator